MTQLRTSGLSKEAEERLRRGEAISQLITQDKNRPVSIEEQIIYLYSLNHGLLDNLSTGQIRQFRLNILAYAQQMKPEFCLKIRQSKDLSEDLKGMLEEVLAAYLREEVK